MIALFEKTFPGARWAFVGRDTALIADVFEAFYLQRGEKDRVVRLRVSGPTIRDASEAQLRILLTQEGYRPGKSFVLIDTVSRGGGRQIRQLLDVLYRMERESGNVDANVVRRVNMIGLEISTTNLPPRPLENAAEYLAHQAHLFENAPNALITPEDVLLYGDRFARGQSRISANESGYAEHTGAWNDSYGPLAQADEKLIAIRGAPASKSIRGMILWDQRWLWEKVRSPDFLSRVAIEASRFNWRIPESWTRSKWSATSLLDRTKACLQSVRASR